MRFNNVNELYNKLKEVKYLTSDYFTVPDREFLFLLDGSEKIYHMFPGDWFVIFDFERYKEFDFREIEQKYLNYI